MKKIVVFDLNGTIFNTEPSYLKACHLLLEEQSLFIPPKKFLLSFLDEPLKTFEDWLNSMKLKKSVSETMDDFLKLEISTIFEYGKLYANTVEFLDWLVFHGYEIGLSTNASEEYYQAVFKKFNLEKYFKFVHYRSSNNPISKSEFLKNLVKTEKPFVKYMVGDRESDILSGRENDFITIYCSYGHGQDRPELADFFIDKIFDLEDIL